MRKVKVEVCVGTTCHLMGAHDLVNFIENLPSWMKERIEYSFSPCFGPCNEGAKAPIVKIDGVIFEDMTPEKLKVEIEKALERE